MNLYEWPTPNPAPKPTRHWGLDKSYKIVPDSVVRMSHLVKYVRICTNEPPRKICYELPWDRCVDAYVLEKHVSYARQQISYHMYAKTAYYFQAKHARAIRQISHFFAYQYHEFSFLFWRAILYTFSSQMFWHFKYVLMKWVTPLCCLEKLL